jgi:ankyrin repeat protein
MSSDNRSTVTPIVAVCCLGHADIVKLLLEFGATVTGDKTTTPLHIACFQGHLDVVNILTEHPLVDVEALDKDGRTPLHAAVIGTTFEEIEKRRGEKRAKQQQELRCMPRTSDPGDSAEPEEEPTMPKQPESQHLEIIQLLLTRYNHDSINHRDTSDKTPLEYACNIHGSRVNVAKLLLENGADANVGSRKDTPLHLACQEGNLDLVRLLLDHKADTEATRPGMTYRFVQETPIHRAVHGGYADIVSLLVESGARTDFFSEE